MKEINYTTRHGGRESDINRIMKEVRKEVKKFKNVAMLGDRIKIEIIIHKVK